MSKIIAHDMFHRLTDTHGNLTVEVELNRGEHHSTNRAAALAYARQSIPGAVVCAYLGKVHYRRTDGYPATANRYSVVIPG